jgi:hypothetical protein
MVPRPPGSRAFHLVASPFAKRQGPGIGAGRPVGSLRLPTGTLAGCVAAPPQGRWAQDASKSINRGVCLSLTHA